MQNVKLSLVMWTAPVRRFQKIQMTQMKIQILNVNPGAISRQIKSPIQLRLQLELIRLPEPVDSEVTRVLNEDFPMESFQLRTPFIVNHNLWFAGEALEEVAKSFVSDFRQRNSNFGSQIEILNEFSQWVFHWENRWRCVDATI